MKDKKTYLRFLLMLIPVCPALVLMTIPGFRFSVLICFGISLLTGLFCLLSLYHSTTAKLLRTVLLCLVSCGVLLAGATELYIIKDSHPESADSDYVILLGAGVNGEEPSLMLQNRIDRAYDYLSTHPQTVCVVSGGQGPDESISEAACMFRELTEMGISPDRIWQEDKATSTEENIRFSMDLIEEKTGSRPQSAGIISNEFHLCRAKLMAADQGLEAHGIPAQTSWVSLKINYYVREIAAVWYYVLFGGC